MEGGFGLGESEEKSPHLIRGERVCGLEPYCSQWWTESQKNNFCILQSKPFGERFAYIGFFVLVLCDISLIYYCPHLTGSMIYGKSSARCHFGNIRIHGTSQDRGHVAGLRAGGASIWQFSGPQLLLCYRALQNQLKSTGTTACPWLFLLSGHCSKNLV